MNILKDQLKAQRHELICKIKVLQNKRQALKGVKNTSQQWKELTIEIASIQAGIDFANKSLGIPVKPHHKSDK